MLRGPFRCFMCQCNSGVQLCLPPTHVRGFDACYVSVGDGRVGVSCLPVLYIVCVCCHLYHSDFGGSSAACVLHSVCATSVCMCLCNSKTLAYYCTSLFFCWSFAVCDSFLNLSVSTTQTLQVAVGCVCYITCLPHVITNTYLT